jgi:hypothetical protein
MGALNNQTCLTSLGLDGAAPPMVQEVLGQVHQLLPWGPDYGAVGGSGNEGKLVEALLFGASTGIRGAKTWQEKNDADASLKRADEEYGKVRYNFKAGWQRTRLMPP